ncbi:MAG: AI-2E family transporter [Kofleriaceae bacterium]
MSELVRHRIEVAPRTFFLVLGLVAAVVVVGRLTTVVSVLGIALVLVGTLDPLVAWLERHSLRRGPALVLVMVMSTLVLAALVLLIVPPFVAQALDMLESAPQARTHLVAALGTHRWGTPFVTAVKDLPLDTLSAHAGIALLGYSTFLFEVLGYGISTLFLAIYMLADPAGTKGMLYAVVPRHHHVKLAKILLELEVIVGGYMRGQLITSLAIGAFVFGVLTALGVGNALPIALFASIADVLPFVGGYVATVAVVIAAATRGTTTAMVVAAVMLVYLELETRLLIPRVYERVSRLPPAIALVALLVGGSLGGVVGALLAVPIAAGLRMVITELRLDLPGTSPSFAAATLLDEQASTVYEHLTEGSSSAEAGVIADSLATMVKDSETGGEQLSAQLAGADRDAP